MSDKKLISPGARNQAAGDYYEVGPRGGQIEGSREVHLSKDGTLPPTGAAGRKWTLKEEAK